MIANDYLTPEELLNRYPQIKALEWGVVKIGKFYTAGLLQGYRCNKENKSLILESSFINLIQFANNVTKEKELDTEKFECILSDYSCIDKLISIYPKVRLLGWSSSIIGSFLRSGLLLGYYTGKGHKAMILECSFTKLIKYANDVTAKRRMDIDPKGW